MSQFSVFIHQHFGTNPNQTVADIIVGLIPDTGTLGQVKEIVADAVAVMEGTGLTGDQKKMLVTTVVNFALQAAHINIPASLVSFLIEEAVLLLKGGKSSPTPVPAPTPAPVVPYGVVMAGALPADAVLLSFGFKSGDAKWTGPNEWQVTDARTVLGSPWTLVGNIA
jgi:hypothetical protein